MNEAHKAVRENRVQIGGLVNSIVGDKVRR